MKKYKRTNEFGFFAVKSKKAKKKTNSFVRFLGESTARQSAYGFVWPLVWIYFIKVDIETALVEMDLLSGEPPVYTKEVQFQYIEM